ncbi:GNAT family N-acetyltransferase [Flavobacterium sp.]|uniref:GNAT family N-acetyltransferase n=1 Tax=Flavobacterium sp. TaxID=239 RepID=UPI0025BDD7E0|nr:GNAT family N-acetyltransferase [Flavobacterium sp.]
MKIINPIIDPRINLTKNFFSSSDSSRNKAASSAVKDTVEAVDFIIEKARCSHTYWIKEICEATLLAAKARGIGISECAPELLEAKMKKGDAVIAFASDGRWAGFSFINSWENESYVSNSGLVVAPEFKHTELAKKIKIKIFELSREKYPNARIFSLTSDLAVVKMYYELGFKQLTFSELTSDELFWKSCKSCVNCPVVMNKERKTCLCTAMLYDPKHHPAVIDQDRKNIPLQDKALLEELRLIKIRSLNFLSIKI